MRCGAACACANGRPALWCTSRDRGAIGVFVDLGLAVGGFVDVLMLPFDATQWPTVGTVAEFEIWWMDERPQIRLKPIDPAYLREDFGTWARKVGFPAAMLSSAAEAVAESDGHS
jgi:hypothetical protein